MKEKVKLLREQTGQGILECKKALEASGGDIEQAKVYLAKRLKPLLDCTLVTLKRD